MARVAELMEGTFKYRRRLGRSVFDLRLPAGPEQDSAGQAAVLLPRVAVS